MCTLTYIPKTNGGFILTQNRDESPKRPKAEFPATEKTNNHTLHMARDPQGKGSWMMTLADGTTFSILNGGSEPHKHNPPYKHSRGLVPFHFLEFSGLTDFLKNYDFSGIEPFTLIITSTFGLFRIVWTGSKVFRTSYNPSVPHIIQSNQLYTKPIQRKREKWFAQFLKNHPNPTLENIKKLHLNGGNDNPNEKFLLQRDEVSTIGISQRIFTGNANQFFYHDLIAEKQGFVDLG